MITKVYSIEDVQLDILKTHPPTLRILATGLANTTGWTNPQLIPYVYIAPPADGIYDFDFCAEPPAGIALEVLTPIASAFLWRPFPDTLKGVRVHSSSGSKEACLSGREPKVLPTLDAMGGGGGEIPSPFSDGGRTMKVPHFFTGLVVDAGIGWCRDGATHRLLHHSPTGGALNTRLKAANKETEDVLKRVSGSRQRVMVAGYMHSGIEPGCDYLFCYYAGPEIGPDELGKALTK